MSVTDIIPVGLIYKLTSPAGKIYIGSTRQTLEQRLREHKSKYKGYLAGTREFLSSIKLFEESEDIKIILLDQLIDCTKEALYKLERQYIESCECVNMKKPIQTKEEVEEYVKEYNINYGMTHKEEISACKKEYYLKNQESILEYKKQYRKLNQEKIKAKIICDCCGIELLRAGIRRHERTGRHIQNAKTFEERTISAAKELL
jgi:predicted GIY-YIG superfamily endonuclease